jgi:hypothetical protein
MTLIAACRTWIHVRGSRTTIEQQRGEPRAAPMLPLVYSNFLGDRITIQLIIAANPRMYH